MITGVTTNASRLLHHCIPHSCSRILIPTRLTNILAASKINSLPTALPVRSHRIWSTKLKTMKLQSKLFTEMILTPELKELNRLFASNHYELRIAGGAVRDLIMDKMPGDVDFATTATPQEMVAMFERENIRMINDNGLKHGTVTVRIEDKVNYEITTLRIDVRTDGRWADVEFTKDWMIDANRRDLTVNSLFLDLDGTVHDYFNGIDHIKSRTIQFVGDAATRIKEDYLRILRYFRFFGVMRANANQHDQQVLSAIKENAHGLAGIAGERIWVELKKIMVGPDAPLIVKIMQQCDLFQYMGLPTCEKSDVDRLGNMVTVYKRAIDLNPNPIVIITSLMSDRDELAQFHKRIKLSNEERDIAVLILHSLEANQPQTLKHYINMYVDMKARNISADRKRISELIKYTGDKGFLDNFEAVEIPNFPVTGLHLAAFSVPKGPKYAIILSKLRDIWKESDFKMSADQLMGRLDEVMKECERVSLTGKKSKVDKDDLFPLSRKRRRIVPA